MKNEYGILIVVIFIAGYFLLFLLFNARQKKQNAELKALLEEKKSLEARVLSNEEKLLSFDSKSNKTTLAYEQTRKIESLEADVLKQKKRIHELRLIGQNASMTQHNFLSNITSEIKRPVVSVLNSCTILQTKLQDKTSLNELKKITYASNLLFEMLSDIVDLSKIEAKTFEISENVVNLRFLLNKIIEKKQNLADKKSLLLTLEIDEKLPDFLMLDALKVEAILDNLIDNAIKFTQEGYVKVSLSVDEINVATNTLLLSIDVEDSGEGIAQEFQDKVFKVFENLDDVEHNSSEKIGLGLSINKKIALLMHGNITLESEVSKGSIFKFTLADVEIALLSAEDSDEENSDFSLIKADSKVMIVAEYNKNHQTILDAFENTQVELFSYSDLREAIETLKSKTIDLIFIDVEILNIDDGAVSKVLSHMTYAGVVPLVHDRIKEITFTNKTLHPVGFLKKPISKSELFKISFKVLNS